MYGVDVERLASPMSLRDLTIRSPVAAAVVGARGVTGAAHDRSRTDDPTVLTLWSDGGGEQGTQQHHVLQPPDGGPVSAAYATGCKRPRLGRSIMNVVPSSGALT